LEAEPAIIPEYLKYMKVEGFEIVKFGKEVRDEDVFAVVIRSMVSVDRDLLEKYSNLCYVLRVGVGLDKVDLDLCKEKNIIVLNTPGANADAVADMAMWGLLSILRCGKKLCVDGFSQKFDSRFSYSGIELGSQKVWIIGFGKVGKKFYERCCAFGTQKFCVIDPFLTQEQIESFVGCKKYKSVDACIADLDILALFVPLTDGTRNLVYAEILEQAKKNLKLINLWRWGVVNESNLYSFLISNSSAAAYLDVWEGDPELTNSIRELMKLGNCLVTPHVATMTDEAIRKMHFFQLMIGC